MCVGWNASNYGHYLAQNVKLVFFSSTVWFCFGKEWVREPVGMGLMDMLQRTYLLRGLLVCGLPSFSLHQEQVREREIRESVESK